MLLLSNILFESYALEELSPPFEYFRKQGVEGEAVLGAKRPELMLLNKSVALIEQILFKSYALEELSAPL